MSIEKGRNDDTLMVNSFVGEKIYVHFCVFIVGH